MYLCLSSNVNIIKFSSNLYGLMICLNDLYFFMYLIVILYLLN